MALLEFQNSFNTSHARKSWAKAGILQGLSTTLFSFELVEDLDFLEAREIHLNFNKPKNQNVFYVRYVTQLDLEILLSSINSV